MVSCLIILFEAIAFWICLNLVFKSKLTIMLVDILMVIGYVLIFVGFECAEIDKFSMIAIFLISIFFSKAKYSKPYFSIITKIIIAMLLIGAVEALVMFLYYNPLKFIENENIHFLALSVLSNIHICIVYVVCSRITKKSGQIKYVFKDIKFLLLGLFFVLYLKIDYEVRKEYNVIFYIVSLLFLVIVISTLVREKRYKYELESKQNEIQQINIYARNYEDALEKLRRKQHNYNNQLSVISGMKYTVATTEELLGKQKDYVEDIKQHNKYDKVLLRCNNHILAGYLYEKCVEFEKSNMSVDVDVSVDEFEYHEHIYNIIEILGILLDNAFENEIQRSDAERLIKLYVHKLDNTMNIKVSNRCEYKTFKEIESMFRCGSSSKGENRGIGLFNLKNIVDNSKGIVTVKNIEINCENWLEFNVSIKM